MPPLLVVLVWGLLFFYSLWFLLNHFVASVSYHIVPPDDITKAQWQSYVEYFGFNYVKGEEVEMCFVYIVFLRVCVSQIQ